MILTKFQKDFLDFISESDLAKKVYFTGGTALAYRYNHRLSTDLDFFSIDFLADYEILPFINSLKEKFSVKNIKKQTIANRNIFLLDENFDNLKIELTFFPFKNIKPYNYWNKKLKIDSIIDIGTNKIHAVSERQEIKDLFDLYYIFEHEKITLDELIINVENKFGVVLNKNDIVARLLYLTKNINNIKPFLVEKIDLKKIQLFFEDMV